MGTDPVALGSKTALLGEVLDEFGEGAVFLDGHQLLEDMQGDSEAGGSGMLIFNYREHSIRIVVIDRFGKCAN